MGIQASSPKASSLSASSLSGSEMLQELQAARQVPGKLSTEAVSGPLLPGRPEYEFFDAAFGLVNRSMQTQYRRLVEQSLGSSQWPDRGRIPWSAIEGLNARRYTAAINQTVTLLVRISGHFWAQLTGPTSGHVTRRAGKGGP